MATYTDSQFCTNLLAGIRLQGIEEFNILPNAIQGGLKAAIQRAKELDLGLEHRVLFEGEFIDTIWSYTFAYPISPQFTRIHIDVSQKFCERHLKRTGKDAEKFKELGKVFLETYEKIARKYSYPHRI